MKNLLLLLFFSLYTLSIIGQDKTIEVVSAAWIHYNEEDQNYYQLIESVHLRHDSTDLFCDSAMVFLETNSFEAFGNVLLQRGDSIELICDSLIYFGNKNFAKAKSNVYLRKDTVKLFSDYVEYFIEDKKASYKNHGLVINVLDTLESEVGLFDFQNETISLKEKVYSRNAEIKCNSEKLIYNTSTNYLKLKENVVLKTDSSIVYLDKADYDDGSKKIIGSGNIKALYQNYKVFSDSIQMLTTDSIMWAWNNVRVIDSVEQMDLKSEYAELHKKSEKGWFIDSVFFRQIAELDTMYLYSDSLDLYRKEGLLNVNAVGDVKVYRDDVQAICDSLNYSQGLKRITLSKDPVAWMTDQQIVADTVSLKLVNNALDSMFFIGHVFMIKEEIPKLDLYSQVKGRKVDVNIKDKVIESTLVDGNAEVLYCMFSEKIFDGINTMNGSKLKMIFKNKEIYKVLYLSLVDGNYIPSQQVTKKNRFLLDFKLNKENKVYKVDFQVF